MYKIFSMLISLLILLPLSAMTYEQEEQWIKRIIDYSINTRFLEADSAIQKRLAVGDTSYQTYFYYASVLNSKMTHYENFDEQDQFLFSISKVLEKTDKQLYQMDDSLSLDLAKIYFYRGSAYGYLAYFQGKKGAWYDAMKNGIKSVDDLEKALECDSTLWDAYLGLGVYKYWKSTKLKFVLWLPFISDRREEGIRDIKVAINNDCNSRYLAMHQLVYILLDHKDFDSAVHYASLAVEAYPQSQFMWWAYAHCFYKKHDNEAAIQTYKHLLELIETDPQANPLHWMTIQVRLAEIYQRMDENERVNYHCNLVLNKKYPQPMPETGVKNMEKVRNLLKEAGRNVNN